MLNNQVVDVLNSAEITETYVRLDGELERDLYLAVDKVLKRVGGKWNSRKKLHLFKEDPREKIALVLKTGILPSENPFSYFFTPTEEVGEVIEELKNNMLIPYKGSILEPSAGSGHFADVIVQEYPDCELTLCEIDPLNVKVLEDKGYTVHATDFMEVDFDQKFDAVIMNPPFSYKGQRTLYIDHIMKSFDLLSDNGILAAITPMSWWRNSSRKEKEFRTFVNKHICIGWAIPGGVFKESGTNIPTQVTILKKNIQDKTSEYMGYKSWFFYEALLHLENDSRYYEGKKDIYNGMSFEKFREIAEEVIEESNQNHYAGIFLTDSDYEDLYNHMRDCE